MELPSPLGARKRGRGPTDDDQPHCDEDDDVDNNHHHQDHTKTCSDALLQRLIDPDFEELSRQFPAFGTAWRQIQQAQRQSSSNHHHHHHKNTLAAHMTQEFSIAITKALLHVHLNVGLINVPLHHLCPPVPNRYYYVHWIQTVLVPRLSNQQYFNSPLQHQEQQQQQQQIHCTGLDIGTGAVAIYPLLVCATHPHARMWGTDVSSDSLIMAHTNVYQGNPRLASRIPTTNVDR